MIFGQEVAGSSGDDGDAAPTFALDITPDCSPVAASDQLQMSEKHRVFLPTPEKVGN